MRACEGCRRRKIKCDAATTNTWPCSACIRLKLHCVPPTINYDRDLSNNGFSETDLAAQYDAPATNQSESFQQQVTCPPGMNMMTGHDSLSPAQLPYGDGSTIYQTPPYTQRSASHPDLHYASMTSSHINVPDPTYQSLPLFPAPPGQGEAPSESSDSWSQDQFSAASLSDALGELKIDETGVGTIRTRPDNRPLG